MRRAAVLLAVGLILLGACGGSSSTSARPTARSGTVQVARFAQVQSDILTDARGFALYIFVPDRRSAVTCQDLCAGTWPPVYAPTRGTVTVGAGVQRDLLGSDPDPGTGKQVVTYNGWPLYRYAADPQAGFASGQAVDSTGGEWYVMRPSGQPIVPAGYPQPVPSP